jgi:hypothetical protein
LRYICFGAILVTFTNIIKLSKSLSILLFTPGYCTFITMSLKNINNIQKNVSISLKNNNENRNKKGLLSVMILSFMDLSYTCGSKRFFLERFELTSPFLTQRFNHHIFKLVRGHHTSRRSSFFELHSYLVWD